MKRSRQRNRNWRHKRNKNILFTYSQRGTRAKGKHYDMMWHNLKRVEDDKFEELDCD